MSILESTENDTTARAASPLAVVPAEECQSEAMTPPYRRGDRIYATTPEGTRYQVRIEAIKPTTSGQFSIIGAVTEPRKFRSHVLSTVVGADGYGPAVLRSA